MRRAFTLIELLVVIAIIAILAAILFPIFAQAKLAAKKAQGLAQMKQLGSAIFIYAGDSDDFFVPASARPAPGVGGVPRIWTEAVYPYVKSEQIFTVPGSDARYAAGWTTRMNQNIGYSDATGVDPASPAIPGAALPGVEGFTSAASFSAAEESARIGLFATTAHGLAGTVPVPKQRGYVFNPYNGPSDASVADAAERYKTGLPLIADVDLFKAIDPDGTDRRDYAPGAMKQIFPVYGADGRNNGTTPVIFADSHAKAYGAKALKSFGTVIWRFR